jgi:hypothetical protein
MSAKTLQNICLRKRFLRTKMKRLSGAILVLMAIQLQQANAQDLVLQDTTITTTTTFSASSITAGPNFTIASTGDVILNAETIAVIPQFFIVQGGKLQVVSGATPVGIATEDPIIPDEFIVHQNFPNPFNPETEIRFALTRDSHVVINVYNTRGQQLATLIDSQYAAGFHSVRWDGKDRNGSPVSSGVYLYQIQAGEFSQMRKMSLIK